MSYVSEVMADSPAAYYRMQEASGLLQDSSGNNLDWGVSEQLTYQQTSLIASDTSDFAIRSANGADQDWGYTPDDPLLDLGDVLTLEVWIKRERFATQEYLMSKGADAYGLSIGADDLLGFGKFGVADIVASTVAITDTDRHHCVATKNGSTVKLYLDGADVTGTVSNATLINNGESLNMLRDNTGATAFKGTADELAVYPTALTQARVLAHFEAAEVGTGFGQLGSLSAIGF